MSKPLSKICQRKFRREHREEYNKKKRIYWEMNHEHLLEKRRENYQIQKAKILGQQKLYRQKNQSLKKINYLRTLQKELAQHFFEFEEIKSSTPKFEDRFPTLLLS